MEKPSWWPPCPYPKEIFPMTEKEARHHYSEAFKEPGLRTAVSGALGRMWWEMAEKAILQAMFEEEQEG